MYIAGKQFAMRIFFKAVLFLLFFGCSQSKQNLKNNAIATAHPLATQAGEQMFALGGSAADAAVAAAFTLAVVEPSMSGLGGRLQAIYTSENGTVKGIDASTEVPAAYVHSTERHRYGYSTIAIPGVVAGLLELHGQEGVLPLEQVMAPAINHAENGFLVLPGEAARQAKVVDQLAEFEGSKKYFLTKDGSPLPAGYMFLQKDLAGVLKRIAQEGHKGFYEGETAALMVSDLQANGSIITLEDLKNYKALPAKVLDGDYRDYSVKSLYLPSFGAITIQILQGLNALPAFKKGDSEWAAVLGEITQKAYENRRKQDDPDSLKMILSKESAEKIALGASPKKALVNDFIPPRAWQVAMGHTTHLSAADASGRVVSLTQTVGPNMGSKVASPGLGFLYAVTLGGYLGQYQPGDRANSHISPTLLLKDNKVHLAIGAAGGSRIPTSITQVTQRYLDEKWPLAEALALPRIYPNADTLLLEKHPGLQWPEGTEAALDAIGKPYKYITEPARFGRVHAIALDTLNQRWIGAADPDWEGTSSQ